jgi:hypothetical protein
MTHHAPRLSPCPAICLTPSTRPLAGPATCLTDALQTLLYREILSHRKSLLPLECLSYPNTPLIAQPISRAGRRTVPLRGLRPTLKANVFAKFQCRKNDFGHGTGIGINALIGRISHYNRRRSTWALVEASFFGCWAFPFPSSSCWRCSGTTRCAERHQRAEAQLTGG